jgi:hypothetical protein
VPTVTTVKSAGPVTLTETAYRSPIWPDGADVLAARLTNGSQGSVAVRLEVVLPETVGVVERMCVARGHPVVSLPKGLMPTRRERRWGCTGGVVALPGWAKPQGECDPAFKNISAGMGGVPITYRFAVDVGAKRNVILGLCESHWSMAGQRPLKILAEGADEAEVDCIGAWGQHMPGALQFDAADANGDGRLELTIAPHPDGSDKNPILNVVWIFGANERPELDDVIKGKANGAAEYYVDVGGENDQSLYAGGTLTYDLTLPADGEQGLTFLLACPGARTVPDPETTAWTPASLRRAAEDVWRGRTSQVRQ